MSWAPVARPTRAGALVVTDSLESRKLASERRAQREARLTRAKRDYETGRPISRAICESAASRFSIGG